MMEANGNGEPEKLRVLCLHGYRTDAQWMQNTLEMGLLQREELLQAAEFVYVTTPAMEEGDFGWWHARDPEQFGAEGEGLFDWTVETTRLSDCDCMYDGWSNRTLPWFTDLFQDQGPFHGVLGFDQGAACAALLCAVACADARNGVSPPRFELNFAILIAGYQSSDGMLRHLYNGEDGSALIKIPSLHCIGAADVVVPQSRQEHLATAFVDPFIFNHKGQHVVPDEGRFPVTMSNFLRLQRHQLFGPGGRSSSVGSAGGEAGAAAQAATHEDVLRFPLWADTDATDEMSEESHIMVHQPPHSKPGDEHAAFVVLGGQNYNTSEDDATEEVAEFLVHQGIVAVVLAYRPSWPHNYADLCRAMRLVKELAPVLHVDVYRVGVMGFSAGGHLASLLSTQPGLDYPERHLDDLAPLHTVAPSRVVLCQPLISFVECYVPGCFAGAVDNFCCDLDPPFSERERFSNERHVMANHPPVFAWATSEDAVVPPDPLRKFRSACRRVEVPCEVLEYPTGKHGLGLAVGHPPASEWPTQMMSWLGTWAEVTTPKVVVGNGVGSAAHHFAAMQLAETSLGLPHGHVGQMGVETAADDRPPPPMGFRFGNRDLAMCCGPFQRNQRDGSCFSPVFSSVTDRDRRAEEKCAVS